MANKALQRYIKNQQTKRKVKKTYIIYIKTQHKKNQTKRKKMLTRRAKYVIILLSQGEKTKIEIKI